MNAFFFLLRIRSLWILVILFVVGEVPVTRKKVLSENIQPVTIFLPSPRSTKISETKPTEQISPTVKPATILQPTVPNALDSNLPKSNEAPTNSDLSPSEIARSITVKITAPDFIGSGTIVGFDKSTYTVITNAHVIISGQSPYRITTSDRVIHQAKVISSPEFKKYDLAVIQFRAPAQKYLVARLGTSNALKVGDRLFVGGFTKQSTQRDQNDFLVRTGAISLLLKSGMHDSGYKIGYTHRIYRGMSGGSVIDATGKLVGINGLLGDPIWKAQTKFADGSIACEPLQTLIDRSGFAIAIDDITSLIVRAKWWPKPALAKSAPVNEEASISDPEAVVLQQSADKALSCN
jgi:serine protease DegQ